MGLLDELGYTEVRHYSGGLDDWLAQGGPVASYLDPGAADALLKGGGQAPAAPAGPAATAAPAALTAKPRPARLLAAGSMAARLLERLGSLSTHHLFVGWVLSVAIGGGVFWLLGHIPEHGLHRSDGPLGTDWRALWDAVYFSGVTATTLGYGDLAPRGLSRLLAVAESAVGLLVFGAVVSKLVSRRQSEVTEEIHRLTFESRLGRVQTNLNIVIADLQVVTSACKSGALTPAEASLRMESLTMIFAAELRTVHDLLYRPQTEPDEQTLEHILVSLSAALDELERAAACVVGEGSESQNWRRTVRQASALAREICGQCVPTQYAPNLTRWMDRIQATAESLAHPGEVLAHPDEA